jgi:hypothetical protein
MNMTINKNEDIFMHTRKLDLAFVSSMILFLSGCADDGISGQALGNNGPKATNTFTTNFPPSPLASSTRGLWLSPGVETHRILNQLSVQTELQIWGASQ